MSCTWINQTSLIFSVSISGDQVEMALAGIKRPSSWMHGPKILDTKMMLLELSREEKSGVGRKVGKDTTWKCNHGSSWSKKNCCLWRNSPMWVIPCSILVKNHLFRYDQHLAEASDCQSVHVGSLANGQTFGQFPTSPGKFATYHHIIIEKDNAALHDLWKHGVVFN